MRNVSLVTTNKAQRKNSWHVFACFVHSTSTPTTFVNFECFVTSYDTGKVSHCFIPTHLMLEPSKPDGNTVLQEHYDHFTDDDFVPSCILVSAQEVIELHHQYLQSTMNHQVTLLSPAFPPNVLQTVRLLMGNQCCVDCGGVDYIKGDNGEEVQVEPLFSDVAHGTLVCRKCALSHLERDEGVVSGECLASGLFGC